MESFKEKFNAKLKPKQHLLTHYPSVIRLLGPTNNYWMMRNFTNITKTLARKHQQKTSRTRTSLEYEDLLEVSHKMVLRDANLISRSIELINDTDPVLFNIKFIKLNGTEYRNGLMLTKDKQFFEIKNIISDGEVFFMNALLLK